MDLVETVRKYSGHISLQHHNKTYISDKENENLLGPKRFKDKDPWWTIKCANKTKADHFYHKNKPCHWTTISCTCRYVLVTRTKKSPNLQNTLATAKQHPSNHPQKIEHSAHLQNCKNPVSLR